MLADYPVGWAINEVAWSIPAIYFESIVLFIFVYLDDRPKTPNRKYEIMVMAKCVSHGARRHWKKI
jgi:hypothetical protein